MTQPDAGSHPAFEIAYEGRTVELVIAPRAVAVAPTVAEVVAALEESPLSAVDLPSLERALAHRAAPGTTQRIAIGAVSAPPETKGACTVIVSKNGRAAFAVPAAPAPPAPGPAPAAPLPSVQLAAPDARAGAGDDEHAAPG
ncbi:MAG: hypothetical protein FJZ92_12320, partial [Chloroflexi bacterium]|nr:hypothetical protein [Chloroflexota bacterium]